MNIKKHTYIILSALAFTACSHDDNSAPTYTVGDADNAIVLSAGIAEGPSSVSSRGAEDNHTNPGHKTFTADTKLRLRVDGTWKGKGNGTAPHGTITSDLVSQTTTATIGDIAENTNDKHNKITFTTAEQLYWDDYGTADPANIDTPKGTASSDTGGRGKGLTIYGVAVDGEASVPTTLHENMNWESLSWNVGTAGTGGIVDQSNATNYRKAKDLLISNNVKEDKDGTLKFDALYPEKNNPSDLLEFTHAMSKITFRLIANEGFPTTEGVGNTEHQFASAPEVILTSNEGTSTTNTEWPYTSCTVDVTTGNVTGLGGSAKVKMHQGTVPTADANTYTAIYDALVAPGSVFNDKGAGETDPYPIIARINADGNIYYVTSKEIRAAITTKYGSGHENGFTTESGKNYIITVRVNKTKIDVTATIKDWDNVEAEEVTPVINVSASYGNSSGTALGQTEFSFYRSTSLNNGYSASIELVNDFVPSEAVVKLSETKWVFTDGTETAKPLYWSDHNTHYQMRGVWPLTSTVSDATGSPRVKASTNHSGYQVIEVSNVAYTAETFPSDLAIGRPNVTEEQTCSNSDHTPQNLYSVGICATEGTVNLDFEYMMSQVEVNLSTTDGSDQVNLTGATVEITNLYTTGEIKLGDREAFTTGSTSLYPMTATSTANQFKNAIVPQILTFSEAGKESNVRFKITITNSGDNKDIYYADIKPIKKNGVEIAPNGKWERGKRYVYYLKLAKTKIDVTATFKNWDEVEASENVWF